MRGAQDIVVAGAGAIGGAIAYGLARAGHRVTVVDPAPIGGNASGIAAGMLAPAFETLFDKSSGESFELLAAARDLWPGLAGEIGGGLIRGGALAVGPRGEVEAWAARLADFGARRQVLGPGEAAQMIPGLRPGDWAVFSPEDWRLDPLSTLRSLRSAAEGLGARFVAGEVVGWGAGRAEIDGAAALAADTLVVATGAARGLAGVVPELQQLTPVKGHILRAAAPWAEGPVVRAPGVYLCRRPGEAILGATMEPGRADTDIDAGVVAGLVARAERLAPGLGALAWRAAAGVRAASPDGLPLVGASRTADVILAVGARRNGWLLAPLMAEAVLAAVGGAESAWAALFAPDRFGAPPKNPSSSMEEGQG